MSPRSRHIYAFLFIFWFSGTGGRMAVGGSTLAQYVAKTIATQKPKDLTDPREAFLRHAKEAEENPMWISPAYAK